MPNTSARGGVTAVSVYGGMDRMRKDMAFARFCDDVPLLVCTDVGSEGHNLQSCSGPSVAERVMAATPGQVCPSHGFSVRTGQDLFATRRSEWQREPRGMGYEAGTSRGPWNSPPRRLTGVCRGPAPTDGH